MLHSPGRTCSTGGSGLVEGRSTSSEENARRLPPRRCAAPPFASAQQRVAGEAEQAFADLAAHDLRRAARDRERAREDLGGLDAASGPSASAPTGPRSRSAERGQRAGRARRVSSLATLPSGPGSAPATARSAERRFRSRMPRRSASRRPIASSAGRRRRRRERWTRSSRSNRRSPTPLPPPMLTRSLPSVDRATRPPAVDRPDDVVVGHEHVVEEHLAEQLAAARSRGAVAPRRRWRAGRSPSS